MTIRHRRTPTAVSLAAALLGAATLTTPATAAPVSTAAVAGAPTSGDSLFPAVGNSGYDVIHYAISLSYASGAIDATTVVTARADEALSSFSLDLEGLTVESVSVDSHAAAYSRKDHKLTVTPSEPVTGKFTVAVQYKGVPKTHTDPDGAADGWIPTKDGATVVSEPVGAMTWFPNNNTPRDKATYTVAVNAPKQLEVAGNGDLSGRRRHGSTTTWTWAQTKPMASYLAMISIGNYHVYRSTMTTTTGRRLPIWSFIEVGDGSMAAARALVPKIIRSQERHFGRYPFTSTGIVVKDLDVDYSLETQNRPVFDIDLGKKVDTGTLVHELAHQWYGDSVTPRDWGDIWLNEGFATYAEWWWNAEHGGKSRTAKLHALYDKNPEGSKLWSPAPAALTDPADLFGSPVYTRGAMTLEALRHKVGNSDFEVIMKRWATSKRGRTVTTAQFIALAEQVSGRDLGAFFRHWIYRATRPVLP